MSEDIDVLENAAGTQAVMDLSPPSGLSVALAEATPPSLPVSNGGKDPQSGRFLPGNRLAAGSGVGRKTARFRARLFAAVSKSDYGEVVGQLVTEAKKGRPWAIKLLLSYLAGSPEAATEGRLEILEMAILHIGGRGDEF